MLRTDSLTDASGGELPGGPEGEQSYADGHTPLLEDQQIPRSTHKKHFLDLEKHSVSFIFFFA